MGKRGQNVEKFQDKFRLPSLERSARMLRKLHVSKLQNKFQAKYVNQSLRINARQLQDIFHAKFLSVNVELCHEKNAKISQDVSQRKSHERLIARSVQML